MVKVLTFLKRKPGMSVEEFQRYWLTRHPAVVVRLPGVRRYVRRTGRHPRRAQNRTRGVQRCAAPRG